MVDGKRCCIITYGEIVAEYISRVEILLFCEAYGIMKKGWFWDSVSVSASQLPVNKREKAGRQLWQEKRIQK